MDIQPNADDFFFKLPELSARQQEDALVASFSLFIESLDTETLVYLRRMLVANYTTDPLQSKYLDVLDGERVLRSAGA